MRMAMASLVLIGLTGCAPQLSTREFAPIIKQMAEMINEQGVLDQFTSSAEGSFINPGLEAYMVLEAKGGVRLQGAEGELMLATSGTGTQLPSGLKQSLIDQLSQPIGDDQRNAILQILGWNRTPADHVPPTPSAPQ